MKPGLLAIRLRRLLSKDVKIPVVGSNLVAAALWVVPLIEHSLDLILSSFKPESNRPFIGFSARVTLHFQDHQLHCRPDGWNQAGVANKLESDAPRQATRSRWECGHELARPTPAGWHNRSTGPDAPAGPRCAAHSPLSRNLLLATAYHAFPCASWTHVCFSKSSCATRLKASAATVLSSRGAVIPHVQWEQHQPLKSSPSTQIRCLFIHLPCTLVGF